ncbi:FAD-binding protein [Brenneria tiliae]|uniref:FAD-binding protein n=1 Tax=Brenneria tiliae TaxID=2914984 RepID=A0ABT0MVT1_9GAMM|nr:FAD-binding protein [Brenneria tiliae]MCL2893971.1 FAD-binding protein [Brenneria tiliae]
MANLLPHVFVYADKAERLAELIAGARQYGEQVSVLCVGEQRQAQHAAGLGADVVYHFEPQQGVVPEDYVPSFANAVKTVAPSALILLAAGKRGKAIAARLGAQLDGAVINDALDLRVEDQTISARHTLYGGLAYGTERTASPYSIVTFGSGVFAAAAVTGSEPGIVRPGEFIAPRSPLKFLAGKPKPGGSVDLAKARRIVGIGRGIGHKEDIALALDLAQAIDAEVGCSRPIAEGEGWMDHDRYIGVSGVTLNADLYIAVGISGQIQHMVGANQVKTIVAINKDKNAPIFNSADYGIVGDLYKILPALSAKLSG